MTRDLKNDKNEFYYRNLILRVTHKHLRLHIERFKTYSTLLVQLKIEKIEINQFLYVRLMYDRVIRER